MTTMYEQNVDCFFCGTSSQHGSISSSNTLGSSDLDTRPAEMKRSTICYWVQRCPSCGYCDDENNSSAARGSRLEAIRLIGKGNQEADYIADQLGA